MAVGDSELPVVVGGPEGSIEFGQVQHAPDSSGTRIAIRILAPGVDARTAVELESWHRAAKSMTEYFADLAGSWQGWSGTKEWHDDGPNVWISATHDGVGLVKLDVRADPFAGWDGPGSWQVIVRVPVEPGALDAIAQRLAALLIS